MITFKHEFNLGITTISMDCSEHSNLILAFHQVVRITNKDTKQYSRFFGTNARKNISYRLLKIVAVFQDLNTYS
jgi:hypothetical protein